MSSNELKTNKVRRLRGSASIREDGTFDFRPDGQGTSKQEDIKTVRKSRSYRTSGEKQQKPFKPQDLLPLGEAGRGSLERPAIRTLAGREANPDAPREYGSR